MTKKVSLYRNEEFLKKLFALTSGPTSASKIAAAFPTGIYGLKMTDSTITSVWKKYGGKNGFLTEMTRRQDLGLSLTDEEPEKKAPLMTEAELHRLARMLKRTTWKHALRELRPNGPPIEPTQAQDFVRSMCITTTGFFERYGCP